MIFAVVWFELVKGVVLIKIYVAVPLIIVCVPGVET